MNLAEKLLGIHRALRAAGIDHAFGGAIALAYWTREPRGTRDIDVNIFTAAEECRRALEALPAGIAWSEGDLVAIERDGQARLWWEDTPIDVFFSYAPLHDEARDHRRLVPFEGTEIPILGPLELAAFKAVFDRTRDWADIEEMIAAETLDTEALREHLGEMLGEADPRLTRLSEAVTRAGSPR